MVGIENSPSTGRQSPSLLAPSAGGLAGSGTAKREAQAGVWWRAGRDGVDWDNQGEVAAPGER